MINVFKSRKTAKIKFVFAVIGIVILGTFLPELIIAEPSLASTNALTSMVKKGHLTICKLDESSFAVVKTVKMVVTAYSSRPEETDSTPFTTASGQNVADGIVANNMLPFGTKIKIPELYGDKVFTVQDRMNQKKGKYHVDIWLPEYISAKNFGAKVANIQVVES